MNTTTTAASRRIEWVHGTTTYTKDGAWFIATDSEGFTLHRTARPFGPGQAVGTFATLAHAKHHAAYEAERTEDAMTTLVRIYKAAADQYTSVYSWDLYTNLAPYLTDDARTALSDAILRVTT